MGLGTCAVTGTHPQAERSSCQRNPCAGPLPQAWRSWSFAASVVLLLQEVLPWEACSVQTFQMSVFYRLACCYVSSVSFDSLMSAVFFN